MKDQSASITPILVELFSLVVKEVVIDFGIEVVPADAADNIEILIQPDLIGRIDAKTDSACVGIRCQCFHRRQLIAAWDGLLSYLALYSPSAAERTSRSIVPSRLSLCA